MKTLHTIYTNFAKRLVMLLIILITIGIGSAWGEDYELVTTITDGEYVIGAVKGSAGNNTTIYAINSTDGTSWKSATETTPSNGKISNPSSSIVWTLTKTGDNSFTLKNGSIYLTIATTTGSGSVRSNSTSPGTIYFASTGSNSTFEISGVSTFTVSSGNQVGYNIGSGYRQYAQRGHSTATSSGSISTQFRFYKKTASTFTVKCQSNNASYGAVSQPSVTNVANNTSISSNGNKLTIGSTIVTATPKEQDANYTYAFSNWSGIPAGGKVTADVTVTANFTRTARALTNYRTSCTTETVVTLDPNGGAIDDDSNTQEIQTENGTLFLPTPTRDGYTFTGWNTEEGDTFDAGENTNWDESITTLYAQWCATLSAPTGLNATPTKDGATIYWNKVTGARGYEISINDGNWISVAAGDNPSYNVTGIECGGTTVTYVVRAVGDTENGYCDYSPSSTQRSFETADCDCPNTYSFHYKNEGNWITNTVICFSPVEGATNNYLTDELYLPYSQFYKVAWQGQDQSYSVETEYSGNMPFYHNRDKKFGANPQHGNLGGGKGKFHVYHDSGDHNKYISFIPTGYTLNFGSGDEWNNDQTLYFTPKTSNWDEEEWYTDLVTLTNDQINKQIFVGLQTEVDYVWCEPYSEKLNIAGMRTKTGSGDNWVDGGMNTSYANKTGKFRIYADSGDKNWYVTFVPHYQLKYDANGGTGTMNPMPAEPVSCEDTEANRTFTVAANTFTRDNYNFTGWNTKADGSGQLYAANNEIVLTGDVTLYAQWEQQSCPAYSFHTGGSDVWNTREEDHCFVQKGSTSEWRIDNYIRPNHTHYVVNWQGGKYTNGGSQNATFASRSWDNMPFANVRSATVGQSAYGVKGSLRIYDDSNQENLYISFIPDAYVLKFGTTEYAITQHSGNDYRSEIVEYAASASANYSVSVGVADADGHYVATNHTQEMRHIFLDVSKQLNNGKWTDASAKFAIYYWNSSTNGWSSFMKAVPGETNLYEAWIPSSYTNLKFVRLNSNAGTPNWDSKWNETGNLTIATSNNLFTITDWGAGTWSAYSSKGKFRMHDDSGDKNWYVHFYPHYVLTYNKNHADATGSMEQQSVPKDASSKAITIAECGFARIGYDFVAWNANMNGQGTSYNPGATYTLNADKTLYAKWAPQQYEITYMDQGNVAFSGENATSLPAIHTYGTATAIPDGVKTGYTFGGWYDNPDCTGNPINQLGATDYTSDITLYAKFTINTHTVTWIPAGGNWAGNPDNIVQTYEYGAKINAPDKPTYDCYEFVEWTPTYNAEMTMPDEDLVFTAKWNKLSYTITFKNYDGTVLQTSTVECGETPSYTGTAPTREQTAQYTYTFKGWSPTIDPATQDQVYTAQFDEVTRLYTVTWMVGTTAYTVGTPTDQVEYDKKVTNLPTSPQDDAIGTCANKFMGWSTKSSGSNAENADYYDDLFTTAENSPAITDATTFYAVYATATTTPGTSTTTNKTYSHTITATTWEANGSQTLNGVSWTLSNNGNYYGYDETKGQQVGSGSKPAKSMTLTTSGLASASKITSVTINTSGASDTNAKVSVKVGGTSYLCNSNTSPSITTTATAYEFTGNSTGDIVISWSQTSSKAIYFKSITIKYSNTTTTPEVTEYSNYVTNCCALAPATNLTVSGTTANSATLTWTAPSSTTGITKLQVRNAETDAVVVDDIAVNTTTVTITGLTECTSYQYYIVSVGEDCEVVSNIVTAQPYGGAKTVNYDYNGGSGSVTSFTTSCTNQTITLPAATRTGYDFNGWYTAATGGTRVGDAGETYEPATSPVTLYAQWTKQIYSISFHANGGSGTMANQQADENDKIAKLNANQFTRTDYAFVGWNTTSAGTGTAYTDQQTNITLAQNLTLYAQWAPIVTLNDAGNEETTHPTAVDGTITLPDGANACEPYEFVGWTSVATADWNGDIEEPALVTSPYEPTAPITLYAVYKIQDEGNPNAFKLSFEGGNGKTYYVGSYNSSPYLRGYSNITEEEAVTFIRTKMYPNDDTRYYLHMEHKGEYLYYTGSLNSTSSTPSESQGWVFHTVGDKIKLQSTYSYDPDYLSFSDRDQETINISTSTSGSEFNMLSAVTSTYVAAPLCNQEITITFETGNGDFVANAPATNPLTVTQDETITLPTCEYPGYEFMGWLKDEQQEEPSDIPLTYYTGDYTVRDKSSSITFYAYYKAVPEEVEFTGTDDTELLMYYYDGANYYYASSFDGEEDDLPSMQNCFNATTWTFTNIGSMQYHIQDETGKYLGAVSDNANELSLSNTPKVWNFTLVDGLWKIVCEDSPSRALAYVTTSKEFNNALLTDINRNSAYNYVALGICPYPTYTTNPVLSQGFSITNTAMVTSASGQKVKAASALTLETRNIELPCTFTISAPNITFYDNTGAEVTELTSSAASEQFELHFAYKPTAENTMEYPTITITDDEMKTYTIKNRIYARSLPATFAIVAKVGNLWYALPSQGLNSTTPPAAYPVEVDDMADPTAVTAVPENADWSLRGVYEASRSDATKDRYVANGDNLVFVNNASPAMTLNASSSEEENYLLTDAQYANYYQTNPGLYEWIPTTTDLETYQLTNEQRSRTLSVNTATVFGVHAQDKAVEQVRFLPIQNRYTPAALQVVEWKENSVVIMYNGDPAETASVSVNGAAAQNTTLSAAPRDIAVYELAAIGLAANPTQRLSITIGIEEKVILSIPYIISGSKNDIDILPGSTVAARQEVAKVADLVVLKDAKLTAAGAKSNPYKFRNATIYGGGKLVIPSEKGFGVASLTLRAGGITDTGEYDYVYPQFELRGTFTNSAAKINYDYITDYYHWYHLVLPFAGDLGTIKYPTEFYGANVAANNKGSWQIKRYAGEIRATGNYNAWVDIETEDETSTIAGQGYIFWGAPKKVSVNGGASDRQKWGIQRITMSITAPNAMTAENGDKAISYLSSHKDVPNNSRKDNDQGWNLIGNPYMVNLTDMATTGLHACKLVEVIDPATGKWNGQWEWNDETNIRYLTIPSEHFDTYTAKTVAESVPLVAGRAFFVQLEGEANAITFAAANRASLMPALRAANDKPVDIETGIILSNETLQDEVNFWIKDGKTNDYEYNADYPKTPNNNQFNIYGVHTNGDLSWVATGPEYAAESMPIGYQVPAAGTYMLSLSEIYNSDGLDALYVTDHALSPEVTVDIMSEPYEFSVNQAETNNERFTVSVRVKAKTENGATGLGNVGAESEQIHKFIYQDKMYILHHGVIYDATGKRVITINK